MYGGKWLLQNYLAKANGRSGATVHPLMIRALALLEWYQREGQTIAPELPMPEQMTSCCTIA